MNLNLENNEVEAIIKVLGQLPTSSNAYPLMMKIVQQVQLASQEEAAVKEPSPE